MVSTMQIFGKDSDSYSALAKKNYCLSIWLFFEWNGSPFFVKKEMSYLLKK